MCCTITMPASRSEGIRGRRCRNACGPPDEAPIATTLSSPLPCFAARTFFLTGAPACGARLSADTFVRAAAFILETNSSAISGSRAVVEGLHTKSTAPFSNACIVNAAPRVVSELSIITGTLCFDTISERAVRPSIRGMSTSRDTTSGLSCSTFVNAKQPSMAVAITSSSGSLPSKLEINLRINAESSTTKTRIFAFSDCISFPLHHFPSFVFDCLSEDHFSVHNQHDAAIPQNRRAGKSIILYPMRIKGLYHKLLFPDQFIGDYSILFIAGCQNNHKKAAEIGRASCRESGEI